MLSVVISCTPNDKKSKNATDHLSILHFEPPTCDCTVKYRALENGRNRNLVFLCDSFNVSYMIHEFIPAMEYRPLSLNVMKFWSAEKTNLISYNPDSSVVYFRHSDLTDRMVAWRVDSSDFILGHYRIHPSARTTYDEQFDKIIRTYQLERTDTVFEPESLY